MKPTHIPFTPVDIAFGTRVRNRITGDEGFITAKFYQISGCMTVAYSSGEARNRDNRAVTFHSTLDRLEILEGGISFGTQPAEESGFSLGEQVKSSPYGVSGTVIAIAFYPDQATHIEIQPPYNDKEGKLPDAISVAESLVESLEPKPKAATPPAAKQPSPPGQPRSRTPERSQNRD